MKLMSLDVRILKRKDLSDSIYPEEIILTLKDLVAVVLDF